MRELLVIFVNGIVNLKRLKESFLRICYKPLIIVIVISHINITIASNEWIYLLCSISFIAEISGIKSTEVSSPLVYIQWTSVVRPLFVRVEKVVITPSWTWNSQQSLMRNRY